MRTRIIAGTALLSAMGVILACILSLPIIPIAPFLKYDLADIPIFFGTFLFGPASGLIMTVVVSVIQGLTVSAETGVIGIFMHIVATGTFVFIAGNIYKRFHSTKGMIVSTALGVLGWLIMMIIWNIIFTPIFMGTPLDAVLKIMLPAIIPFNILKAGVNSIIAVILYNIITPRLKFLNDITSRNKLSTHRHKLLNKRNKSEGIDTTSDSDIDASNQNQ